MSLKDNRVLITGATGFIGSHLVRRLVSEGAQVVSFGGDIRDYSSVEKAVREVSPEIIFHLAAFTNVGRGLGNLELANEINVNGTTNLLCASLDAPELKCFINTGTCEEYGNNPAPFKENMLPWPVSPYSASKSAAWVFCEYVRRTYGLPITNLRPFLTYGPRQKTNMFIADLIVSCILERNFPMSEGKQRRELNHVDDIVEGFILASQRKKAIGETINIGNGVPYSIKEIAEKIVEISGAKTRLGIGELPYRENEIWHLFCDNAKAKEILGWKPKVTLDDGLKRTIEWYRREYAKKS